MMRSLLPGTLLAALLLAAPAFAQAEGRTDGPEGSEVGKGGYTPVSGNGHLALELRFGGAVQPNSTVDYSSDAPLFVGAAVSWWMWDWFSLDAEAHYQLGNKRFGLLVGPRFRTGFSPFAFVYGLHAGLFLLKPAAGGDSVARFGLSPTAGFELTAQKNLVFGLMYALDIPVGSEGVSHRPHLTVGWKF